MLVQACKQANTYVHAYMHTDTQHTLLSLPVCLSSLGSRGKPPIMGPVASPPVFLTRPIAPGRKRPSGGSWHSFRKRKDRRCSRLYFLRPPAVKGEKTAISSGQHHRNRMDGQPIPTGKNITLLTYCTYSTCDK